MISDKIILGIDPGTTIMGFGLIKVKGKNMEFHYFRFFHRAVISWFSCVL